MTDPIKEALQAIEWMAGSMGDQKTLRIALDALRRRASEALAAYDAAQVSQPPSDAEIDGWDARTMKWLDGEVDLTDLGKQEWQSHLDDAKRLMRRARPAPAPSDDESLCDPCRESGRRKPRYATTSDDVDVCKECFDACSDGDIDECEASKLAALVTDLDHTSSGYGQSAGSSDGHEETWRKSRDKAHERLTLEIRKLLMLRARPDDGLLRAAKAAIACVEWGGGMWGEPPVPCVRLSRERFEDLRAEVARIEGGA